MDSLVSNIVHNIIQENVSISIIRYADSLLMREDIYSRLSEESGVKFVTGSNIELRFHYELHKNDDGQHYCYLLGTGQMLMPDIMRKCYVTDFKLTDLFSCYDIPTLIEAHPSFPLLSILFEKRTLRNLGPRETIDIINAQKEKLGADASELKQQLLEIPRDWTSVSTMEQISDLVIKAIMQNAYKEIEPALNEINADFQRFVDENYFNTQTSSAFGKPKVVSKILPYLCDKHERNEMVALVVVDCLSYWQYSMLGKRLREEGLSPKDDITFAWMPSVTELSRQAIFRGDFPENDYNQGPGSEEKLWNKYWTSHDRGSKQLIGDSALYLYEKEVPEFIYQPRVALVDVNLDHTAHACRYTKDLYSITENWVERILPRIKRLYEEGYYIYIATDHGNISSHDGWTLTQQDKTFIVKEKDSDASRGERYLRFDKETYLNAFVEMHPDDQKNWLIRDNWLVWRNTQSFKPKEEITHGGAHFMEMVIPFITIENKKYGK